MTAPLASSAPPDGFPALSGLDHLVFATRDMPRLIKFYCDLLGCTVLRADPGALTVELRAGRSLIGLRDVSGDGASAPAPARSVDHICLALEDWDEAAIRARLENSGAPFSGTAARRGARGQGPSVYLADPDGNVIELIGPPET